jgi:ATP-dependent RNA circularization protein (DNA/RNA ligase family)
MDIITKYPRTKHLVGSNKQVGDHDLNSVPFLEIKDQYLVVEEKIDGANCGISFSDDGELYLQSRGHYLGSSSARERQFNLFKSWANSMTDQLFDILSNKYIMYGEWMYAKHTVFYDQLPHYFMEFDIFDRDKKIFLSTSKRHDMLKGTSIVSVPVLKSGTFKDMADITELLTNSLYKSQQWRDSLKAVSGDKHETVSKETDQSDIAEGLYLKAETENETVGRYKYVRNSFTNAILDSGTHWATRPIIPNQLAEGIEIFK